MDNLIYIWIINRFLEFCNHLTYFCISSTAIALLFFLFSTDGAISDVNKEKFEKLRSLCKIWLIWSIVLSFLFGILGTFKLDKTEFKTVAVYLIGKEIVQGDRGEKIINVIDTKIDEWIKKVER